MLESAFYESPDYRSLIEAGDRIVIVGRRGTGKSALFYKLKKHWEGAANTSVVTIAPEDYETISLQGVLAPFKSRMTLVRAAAKLAWRYALIMEVATALKKHFKFSQIGNIPTLTVQLREWNQTSSSVSVRMRRKVEPLLADEKIPELLVGELASRLELTALSEEISVCLNTLGQAVYILIDRLDEGYEANELGIGLIDGFLHASIEINRALPNIKAFMFLRDNIFRTIAKYDADYSRQIEGQVIRLHWDEYHLLNLIANRLRAAFKLSEEASLSVWNKTTCRELTTRDGFRRCLRLTLYRPRDLLVLLNNAFYHAFQQNRQIIHEDDIESSATEISESRYSDLIKEYHAIFPGIDRLTRAFANGPGIWADNEVQQLLSDVAAAPDLAAEEAQHFAILGSPAGSMQGLYSVGFLGVKDQGSARFKFCHDGNQTKFEIQSKADCLVHPCYWRSLSIINHVMEELNSRGLVHAEKFVGGGQAIFDISPELYRLYRNK